MDLPESLSQIVAEAIPGARLEHFEVVSEPSLRLLLLNQDYPREALSYDVALRLMENPFYWAFCWASGKVLADFLLKHPERVKNKRVLDFGSGSGVVAIAAALAGADEVIACDCDPLARQAIRDNAQLNQVELTVADDLNAVRGPVDCLTASDVLYDRDNLPLLDDFLQHAKSVIIADSRLKHFSHPAYIKIAETPALTLPDLDESVEFRTVRLYTANG